jgi:hypothetical protein
MTPKDRQSTVLLMQFLESGYNLPCNTMTVINEPRMDVCQSGHFESYATKGIK